MIQQFIESEKLIVGIDCVVVIIYTGIASNIFTPLTFSNLHEPSLVSFVLFTLLPLPSKYVSREFMPIVSYK